MNKSAFVLRPHIRNVVLCSLLTLGLAACGEEGSSSSAAASTASDIPSLVAPSIGLIDRTSATETSGATTGINVAVNTTQSNTPVSSTTPTGSTAGAAGSNTVSGTTVASSNRTSTNSSTPVQPSSPSTGTATLDWMPPTENTDGSVLTNLAGYTVYYGTSPGNMTQSVKITNPGLTAYTLSNLPSGRWYFAVTSYSSTGLESSRSGIVSTTI
jgi:hypothetical protein